MARARRQSVGIDLVDVSRFSKFKKHAPHPFLAKVFTKYELDYCWKFKEPATHLAGIFAAKEAASKALGVARYPFAEIEICHDKSGKPYARKNGRTLPVAISITHTATFAAAIAALEPLV